MSILSLTFRDLQYIVALADHKHFGKAAKSCFVSQPALSAQIKKIEEYFSKTFFERHNRQVLLTRDGEFIVEKSRELLQQAKVFDGILQNKQKTFCTPFVVGMIHTLSPYYPSYFMQNLLLKYPHCNLVLKEGFTHDLVADLKTGKIDVLVASEVFYDETLDCHPLFKEPLCLIVNKKHPFAAEENITLSQLNSEDMIFLKEGNCLRNESINLCPKNKKGNIKEFHLSSLETLKYMVAFNLSYAMIPKMAAKLDENLSKILFIKPIKEEAAYRQISLYTRKKNTKLEDIQAFIDVLRIKEP